MKSVKDVDSDMGLTMEEHRHGLETIVPVMKTKWIGIKALGLFSEVLENIIKSLNHVRIVGRGKRA